MLRQKALKFRLKPDAEQLPLLAQFAGCRRFVWNQMLALQIDLMAVGWRVMNYSLMCEALVDLKEVYPFLKEAPSQVLQQTLKDLRRAFDDCFSSDPKRKKGFPKFKKKFEDDSFRYPAGFKPQSGNCMFLPKLGNMKYFDSRRIEGEINSITVSRHAGHWDMSVQVEMEVEPAVPDAISMVGGDMNVANLMTLSDGTVFLPIREVDKWNRKLKKAQRQLAKKRKGSNSWKKQCALIARLHEKIANIRRDVLHKVSTILSKNHAVIVLEDLNVKNMTKSAKGTIEEPGKNVRQKAGLDREILNHAWGTLRRLIEYKFGWTGGFVIIIDPRHTSQRCSHCHRHDRLNRVTQSKFECIFCGFKCNADWNAAINILEAGHALIACGMDAPEGLLDLLRQMKKQEPSDELREGVAQAASAQPQRPERV